MSLTVPPASVMSRNAPRRRSGILVRLALLAVGLSAVLAGCRGGAPTATFPPTCPRTGILADAADLTRYDSTRGPGGSSGGRDLTDMVIDGRITGVSGTCTREDRRHLEVTVAVAMQLTRGPAARGAREEVPFFVAVSEGGTMLDKQVYRVEPQFAANADTLRLTSDPVRLVLPTDPEKRGSAYDVVVGFEVTPDELALNRKRGPR